MPEPTCDDIADLVPELALGTLDGRDRAVALDHLAGCPRCQQELRSHTEVVEQMLDLVPGAEPPAGFETRVLSTIRASRPPAPATPWFRGRRAVIRSAAAAAAAAVIALAGYGLGHRSEGSEPLQRATLTAAGRPVGDAYLYGGAHPWVYMVLAVGSGDTTVTCELERGGHPVATVGTFTLTAGQGYWGAPAPQSVSGATGAVLVDSSGATIAQGTFGR